MKLSLSWSARWPCAVSDRQAQDLRPSEFTKQEGMIAGDETGRFKAFALPDARAKHSWSLCKRIGLFANGRRSISTRSAPKGTCRAIQSFLKQFLWRTATLIGTIPEFDRAVKSLTGYITKLFDSLLNRCLSLNSEATTGSYSKAALFSRCRCISAGGGRAEDGC